MGTPAAAWPDPTTVATEPEQIGIVRGFRVLDLGIGNPPDRISLAYDVTDEPVSLETAAGFCAFRPDAVELLDIQSGNINVR